MRQPNRAQLLAQPIRKLELRSKVSLIERLGAPDDDPVVTEEKAAQGCGRCDAQYVTGVDMRFLA